MNTKNFKTVFAAVLFSVSFSSCQKEKKDNQSCPLTMQSLAGTYQLTSMKYKASPTSPEQDYLFWMDPCQLDDLVTLKSNGTYTYQDLGLSCDPNDSNNGKWSLSCNTIVSDGDIEDVLNGTISSFDCKTLVFYVEGLKNTGDKLEFRMERQ
jgi:Lipocalin-like domain